MHFFLAFQDAVDQTVTITFQPSQVLTWLLVGLIAGSLASLLVRGRLSFVGSLIVGLLGALIGGFLFTLFGIQPSPALASGITIRWIDIIVAFFGALIVLIIVGALFGRRG